MSITPAVAAAPIHAVETEARKVGEAGASGQGVAGGQAKAAAALAQPATVIGRQGIIAECLRCLVDRATSLPLPGSAQRGEARMLPLLPGMPAPPPEPGHELATVTARTAERVLLRSDAAMLLVDAHVELPEGAEVEMQWLAAPAEDEDGPELMRAALQHLPVKPEQVAGELAAQQSQSAAKAQNDPSARLAEAMGELAAMFEARVEEVEEREEKAARRSKKPDEGRLSMALDLPSLGPVRLDISWQPNGLGLALEGQLPFLSEERAALNAAITQACEAAGLPGQLVLRSAPAGAEPMVSQRPAP